jgi:tetratricopeptide (TPR) repeat protein
MRGTLTQRCAAVLMFAIMPAALAVAQSSSPAQLHEEKGEELAQRGDLTSATLEFREAVRLSPTNAQYLTTLGIVLAQQHRLDEAVHSFQQALLQDPGNVDVRKSLAAAQWQAGMLSPARQNLELILKAKPHDPDAQLLLGMVLENSGEYGRAVKFLAPVTSVEHSRPEAIAALLHCYYKTGQTSTAHGMEDEMLRDRNAPAALLSARIASDAGDYPHAEKMLQALHQAFGANAKVDYELAYVRYQTGKYADAEAILDTLTADSHASAEDFNLLAWCFAKQNRIAEAVKTFRQAIELAPGQGASYADLATVLMDSGHLADALEAATEGARVDARSYAAFRTLGMIQTRQNNHTAAVDSYARALQLNSTSAEALVNLGGAQASAGLFREASSTYEEAIHKYPQEPEAYYQYAVVILHHGDPNDTRKQALAASLLEKAVALDPSLADAHYQLATIWSARGDNTKALAELEGAARQDSHNKNIHYSMSVAYRKLGRTQDAESELLIYKKLQAQESAAQ